MSAERLPIHRSAFRRFRLWRTELSVERPTSDATRRTYRACRGLSIREEPPPNSGQAVEEQRPYGCGVGLAAHLAHDRTDERAGGLDLAVTYLLGSVRVGSDCPVHRCLQGAGAGHDCQVPGRDDILGVTLTSEHPVDDLPRQLVVDRAVVDVLLYGRDLPWHDVQLGQLEDRLVGASG